MHVCMTPPPQVVGRSWIIAEMILFCIVLYLEVNLDAGIFVRELYFLFVSQSMAAALSRMWHLTVV